MTHTYTHTHTRTGYALKSESPLGTNSSGNDFARCRALAEVGKPHLISHKQMCVFQNTSYQSHTARHINMLCVYVCACVCVCELESHSQKTYVTMRQSALISQPSIYQSLLHRPQHITKPLHTQTHTHTQTLIRNHTSYFFYLDCALKAEKVSLSLSLSCNNTHTHTHTHTNTRTHQHSSRRTIKSTFPYQSLVLSLGSCTWPLISLLSLFIYK